MCVCTGCSRSNSWVTRYEREKKKRIFYSSMFVRFLRNEIKNETFCSFFFFFFFWSISRGQIRREEKKILTSFQKYCLFKDYEDKLFFWITILLSGVSKKKKRKKKIKRIEKVKKKKNKKSWNIILFPRIISISWKNEKNRMHVKRVACLEKKRERQGDRWWTEKERRTEI